MEILFAVALMVALLLPSQLLRFPSSPPALVDDGIRRWQPAGGDGQPGRAEEGRGEAVDMTLEWGLFTRAFVRRRLDALTEELDRLDHDPDIFAKAFHTMVARSAYQELLVEASKLSDQPPAQAVQALDFELAGSATGLGEELEL